MNPTTTERGASGSPPEPAGFLRIKRERGWQGYVDLFTRRLHSGELGPLPILTGLLATWIVFQILDSNFLTPRNLSNLSVDIVGMGLITVGVVFVLLVGDIDLSIGALSPLGAAVFAVLSVHHGVTDWLAVVLALLSGAAAGAVHGFFVACVGVPAFVATLAGGLVWNGLLLYVLGGNGTVNLYPEGLVAELTSRHFTGPVPYCLAAVSVAAYFLASYADRRRRRTVNVPALPLAEILVRTGVVAAMAFATAVALTAFQGLPLSLVIFLAILLGLDLLLRRTAYGRKVYALGGGFEAARRAGINVVWVRISVFMVSGTLAAVGGLFIAVRIATVGQASAFGSLLVEVTAAALIGGTSLFGGRGRTWSALLGVLVIQSIASGMTLLGVQVAIQYMITGGVLLLAVVADSFSRRLQKAHGRA